MKIDTYAHLTYCTNIHPGETWAAVFESLKKYSVTIKKELVPNKPFGIGLRLSQKSAVTLLEGTNLQEFKVWLDVNNLYVFTMNGFPYGDFHHVEIKDKVHVPDWTTNERIRYTINLFTILTALIPDGMEGGISTSPLSYKLWFDDKKSIDEVKSTSCKSLIEIVLQLVEIKKQTGKTLHLDIEPEPDGFLENTVEVIDFFKNYLLKEGVQILVEKLNCSVDEARDSVLEHLQLCYDICHFSLAYEHTKEVVSALEQEGVRIGKIQISAALKCVKSANVSIKNQQKSLEQFNEPTYLHQAIVKQTDGNLLHFSDLGEGIEAMNSENFEEIRTHFHVPVFLSQFEVLESTQDDIIEALNLWKENQYSKHLEVETYTWGVLPKDMQTDITGSVVRELQWVLELLKPCN